MQVHYMQVFGGDDRVAKFKEHCKTHGFEILETRTYPKYTTFKVAVP